MAYGSIAQMQALASARACQRVIVERRHDGDAEASRKDREAKSQVEEAVDVQDVWLSRTEHVRQL
jgi:hypothetical protein